MSGANGTRSLQPSTQIALTFLMSTLAFAIMLGNAVVILAFVVDKNLRHQSNYFFLNLAISDFFVGVLSLRGLAAHCYFQLPPNLPTLQATSASVGLYIPRPLLRHCLMLTRAALPCCKTHKPHGKYCSPLPH
uniref:G-protein coupled receptors family 1 profile domain-containing protein n=1 Tax=Castor canadensis TaxID=51338 RepID=A0A8C0W105_CASCN